MGLTPLFTIDVHPGKQIFQFLQIFSYLCSREELSPLTSDLGKTSNNDAIFNSENVCMFIPELIP